MQEEILQNQKFIVVADSSSLKPLAIFFDKHIPSLHIELFREAKQKWKKIGCDISTLGGGWMAIFAKHIVFYGQSIDLGPFKDDVVLSLAMEHQDFVGEHYHFISAAGMTDPIEVLVDWTIKQKTAE